MDYIVVKGPEVMERAGVKDGRENKTRARAPRRFFAPPPTPPTAPTHPLAAPIPPLHSSQSSSATVYLHGAHVTSWTSLAGEELLFMSDQAVFAPPKALRGGVPICFPQFSDMGPMAAQHGFARNTAFAVDGGAPDNGPSKVTLLLDHPGSPAFPHPFQLRVVVGLRAPDGALVQRLRVTNTAGGGAAGAPGGDASDAATAGPLPFTAALHTYFRVGDIAATTVVGLGPGGRFLDSTAGRAEAVDGAAALAFDREVDRIYLSPPGPLVVVDGVAGRRVRIATDGLVDAVVWNPWAAKAAALADFGDEDYKRMVCVEPAAVSGGGGVAGLGVGETWEGGQTLVVE